MLHIISQTIMSIYHYQNCNHVNLINQLITSFCDNSSNGLLLSWFHHHQRSNIVLCHLQFMYMFSHCIHLKQRLLTKLHTDLMASYTESSVVHQSHEPSALFPLPFKMSEILALSKPCSSIRAAEVDSCFTRTLARGFTKRMCWRTAFFTMRPCDTKAPIPLCIFTY